MKVKPIRFNLQFKVCILTLAYFQVKKNSKTSELDFSTKKMFRALLFKDDLNTIQS